MRPLCEKCRQKPAAINYYKNKKPYYRRSCESCARSGTASRLPGWQRAGYSKRNFCEKCGFKSKHPEQFDVYHIDGDLNNCRHRNLKTICANCQRIVQKHGYQWRQGDLVPDL